MSCNCKNNERFQDITHVTIIASQCANTLKKDMGIYKANDRYNFEPIIINGVESKRNYVRKVLFDREPTKIEIRKNKGKRKPKSISKDEKEIKGEL